MAEDSVQTTGDQPATAANLTPKQERFAQKYVELGNASEAYRQAYAAANMGGEAVAVEAFRLLGNPKIALRVEALQDLALRRHQVTVDRVIAEYAKLAFLDIRKAFDENGNLKPIHEIDDDTAAAIAGIEAETLFEGQGKDRKAVGTLRKIKLVDKKGALADLGRYLGMFVDKTEVTGKDGGPVELSDAKADLLRRIARRSDG